MNDNVRYTSYLLRLHRRQSNNCTIWVVCVQSTETGEQRWFPNVNALVEFLQAEFGNGETGTGSVCALPADTIPVIQ